jgi:hypothetical protein
MKRISPDYRKYAARVYRHFDRIAERDVLRIIVDICDKAGVYYFRNYPNKIVTSKAGEKILARIPDHQKGKPDITVWCKNGVTLSIETKAPTGKLTLDQMRWRDVLLSRGHEYHAPRTIEEAHLIAKRILEIGR